MVLNITVKTLDSQNYQFEANDDWTVQQFKEHIQPTVNVSSNEQRLIFCGRVLQDDKKLLYYDCTGKVIHLVRRPPPSLDNPSSSTADSNNNSNNYHEGSLDHSRFLSEGNVLISAIALGPETINMNINHISRDPTRRTDHPIFLRATATSHGSSTNTDASHQQRAHSNQRETSRSNQTLEGSVTITTTTVETTPTPINNLSAPSMRPLVDATLVVTSEQGQPPIRIPIPVPIPLGSHGSISIEFRPTTTTREADSSATTETTSEESQPTNTTEPVNTNQSTTSNSTQTAPRVDVIPGRIPLPFNYLLLCFSQWGNYGNTVRNTASRAGEPPTARIQLRTIRQQTMFENNQPTNRPTDSSPANATQTPNPTAVHTSMNRETAPGIDAGLTEVVSNIVGSFFRPPQRSQTNAQQGSSPSFNQDPLLNIIPELAINAASQILGGVLGIPAGSQGRLNQSQTSDRTSQTSSNNTAVMMDIDIDDSSSSQSESRYQDARESHSPSASASSAQATCRPSSSQQSTQSEPRHSASDLASANSSIRYSRQQLIEVMQNHPDWIPIIEADITFMEQQQRTSSNNRPVFSDAYLSSIPRKRRRLLTANSDQVLILQPSASQAINNLLRRAISSSSSQSVGSLEQVLSAISSDTNLQSAYEDHIKSLVEKRLRSDYDYSPSKFENSSKYFK